MNRHRSTSLRYFTKHCPAALGFYERGEPMDRDLFAAGIAAHAVVQNVGLRANHLGRTLTDGEIAKSADATARALITDGRSFDGKPEPPLPPDAAIEGRDLAVAWCLESPPSPTARYEAGLAIDATGGACDYDSADARYVAILDALDFAEAGDEEWSARAAIVTELKSAWPTGEAELDTVQTGGHAVIVAAHYAGEIDVIIRRVVNLRARQVYEHTLDLEADRDTIDRWRRDLLLLCDAADKTREARPGAGCAGCPWVQRCDAAWDAVANAPSVATQYAVAQALRDDAVDLAKSVCKDSHVEIPDGRVGYLAKPARRVVADAHRALAHHWHGVPPDHAADFDAQNGAWLGLLAALNLGVTQVEAAVKALAPGRENRAARDDLLEALLEPSVRKQFGVERTASAPVGSQEGEAA